jgi:hypothetical protein
MSVRDGNDIPREGLLGEARDYSNGMSVVRRTSLVVAAPLVLVVFLAVAWRVLPGAHVCVGSVGLSSRSTCDTGGANVFGSQLFTPAQSIVMALGIWAAAAVLGRALLPTTWRWAAGAFGLLALAVVVAYTLPSPQIGPPRTVPCSTPGPDGPVIGSCVTGPPPVDQRVPDRVLVVTAGLLALGVAVAADRRRDIKGGSPVAKTANG